MGLNYYHVYVFNIINSNIKGINMIYKKMNALYVFDKVNQLLFLLSTKQKSINTIMYNKQNRIHKRPYENACR